MTGLPRALPLILGFALIACRTGGPSASGALAVVDDAGDTMHFAAPARRIVSLIPTTTEILFAAGLGARVVGRTQWCDWPPGVTRVPSLGSGFPPNVEAVIARRPDLVLLYHTAPNAPATAQLRELGIPVLRLRTDRLADVPRTARLLGTVTGASRAADSVARAFELAVTAESARTRAAGSAARSVLLLAWHDPAVVLGASAFLSQLLDLAGGRNAFGDVRASSVPVTLEAIAARDPDAILVVDAAGAGVLERPEWRVLHAVRARRVLQPLDPSLTRAGLRAPLAVAELRRRLAALDAATHTFTRSRGRP
ncbi:MAG TPA: helical backbone metal receptor [Gemmatimonadales bacterium]|nr:helical backbone metal receptor [Gemmatimonadales bacterium]